jgi:hypothetical protein
MGLDGHRLRLAAKVKDGDGSLSEDMKGMNIAHRRMGIRRKIEA